MIKNRYLKLCFVFLIFLALFIKGLFLLDPDFGFHIRGGQIINLTGVPKLDPFSYTMPSFPVIDHEWLTDLTFYKLFNSTGFPGLSITFTILLALALYAAFLRSSKHYFEVPLILAISAIFPYFSVRPQVESWLMLSILLLVIFKKDLWKNFKYVLPFFFVLWANLHGSFALGIFTLLIYLLFKSVRLKKLQLDILAVLFICLLATFVNPYGPRLWYEVWSSISDSSLRWTIIEWQPSFVFFNFPLLAYFSVSIVFVWREKKHLILEQMALYFIFLLAAISSLRHVPLWLIVSLPLTIDSIYAFSEEITKRKFALRRFLKLHWVVLVISLILFISQALFLLKGARGVSEDSFYPGKAIVYLRNNLPYGQIFSRYDWGGYLIWKLPEKKVFVDGRMPSWRLKENPTQESDYAYGDYLDLLRGKTDYRQTFEKYNIDTVLWAEGKKNLLENVQDFLRRFFPGSKKNQKFNLLKELDNDGWHEVYKDSVSVIYKKGS
ncbi:hypothetical protein A3D00_03210 [Candidatus Woesebacteria bacterium RIFCSPHIGHO2_02_FULL_38_9]|uniref:Glycosyltransferase RgtA/B/C/D-like domain-containing protein n=1 Tax=Candidatus Woesebacteria bacterium RIFCSPHIGHO2_01_FULL_39_28 TaxID=1802496 RepID=A0A1F7YI56_9BACT|nr:MAG: hypothetical protein A2627_05655 [Candidatus Woesebacteria bacterium RIFCSPHIGHO2_01_FULL_39_28]OGM31477.1 MAG: hypothetical protein A3D00_03210 [Candidatus Woesebacteria bacterium RIFCSPHIGHO2_02_FULL_38_9]OGM56663.1 MAG: hypothetical protein A3A50_04850 [Candidatus Woesebacteria bacterium RIFCSPLOWO2_01_FULL_38_20]